MRRYGKTLVKRWDSDEWMSLSVTAQWLYDAMVSNANMTSCGVIEFRAKQFANKAAALPVDLVEAALFELREKLFVVFDEDVELALIRSFIRNDDVVTNTNMMVSVVKSWRGVGSQKLKRVIVHELLRLREDFPDQPIWTHPDMMQTFDTTKPLDPEKWTGFTKFSEDDDAF